MSKIIKYMSKNPGTSFSRNQKFQRQESHRIGVGGHWVLLIALLIANALTQPPLLNPPTQGGYSRLPRNVF